MIISEPSVHDTQLALVEDLKEKEDYSGAREEATKILEELEPMLPIVAQAALIKGQVMTKEVLVKMSEDGKLPAPQVWETIYENLMLSKQINTDCPVTAHELDKVSELLREIPPPAPPQEVAHADYDVVIVGAGASGVGTALMLTKTFGIDKKRVVMIERGNDAGETFRQWPDEMRFISPSFNQQGWTDTFDLNSIAHGTSPAYSIHSEHPSGKEYAAYLSAIVKTHELPIRKQTEVVSIKNVGTSDELPLFNVVVQTKSTDADDAFPAEVLTSRYIVWAAGEFQYHKAPTPVTLPPSFPVVGKSTGEEKKDDTDDTVDTDENVEKKKKKPKISKKEGPFPGASLCLHNSQVRSWKKHPGNEFIVIGGYESGVDATVNLSKAGKACTILASASCWSIKTEDPSSELAPYTAARLREVLSPDFTGPSPKLYAPLRVVKVEHDIATQEYIVHAVWKETEEKTHAPLRELVTNLPQQDPSQSGTTLVLRTPNRPILATGFEGSVKVAASHLFDSAPASSSEKNNSSKDTDTDSNNEDEDDDAAEQQPTSANAKKGCLDGAPLLTKHDESTKVPGVFLVGPQVSHGPLSFCFVYKFRQRFAIVASKICDGLGIDTRAATAECRKQNMYLDEFGCCGDTCGDVC